MDNIVEVRFSSVRVVNVSKLLKTNMAGLIYKRTDGNGLENVTMSRVLCSI